MTLGTGIAIAGMWIFAAACALSKQTTGAGLLLAVACALAGTFMLAKL